MSSQQRKQVYLKCDREKRARQFPLPGLFESHLNIESIFPEKQSVGVYFKQYGTVFWVPN